VIVHKAAIFAVIVTISVYAMRIKNSTQQQSINIVKTLLMVLIRKITLGAFLTSNKLARLS